MEGTGKGVRIGHIPSGGSYSECWHCRERQAGCHSHCRAYLAFREQSEARREERQKARREDDDFYGVFANRNKANERARKGR